MSHDNRACNHSPERHLVLGRVELVGEFGDQGVFVVLGLQDLQLRHGVKPHLQVYRESVSFGAMARGGDEALTSFNSQPVCVVLPPSVLIRFVITKLKDINYKTLLSTSATYWRY